MPNRNNQIISNKLVDVNGCVAELADKDLTVMSIEIKDTKPVITIQSKEKQPAGLRGGYLKRINKGLRRWDAYATELQGCQVQWMVPA